MRPPTGRVAGTQAGHSSARAPTTTERNPAGYRRMPDYRCPVPSAGRYARHRVQEVDELLATTAPAEHCASVERVAPLGRLCSVRRPAPGWRAVNALFFG